MEFESFKDTMVSGVERRLNQNGENVSVEVTDVKKVTGNYVGIVLKKDGNSDISPVLYLDNMYESYMKGQSIEGLIDEVVAIYERELNNIENTRAKFNVDKIFDNVEDKIVFQLVNTELHKDVLKDMPHRNVNDLSCVYRIAVSDDERGVSSILVNNMVMKHIGMTEEQMYELAYKNTREIFPVKVSNIADMISSMLGYTPPELESDEEALFPMIVMSNECGVNGASVMLYEDELNKVAEKYEKDLYIIPSSIHEIIAIPEADYMNVEEICDMVAEVNMTAVEEGERLSNEVYFYDKTNRTLTIASDSPKPDLSQSVDMHFRNGMCR